MGFAGQQTKALGAASALLLLGISTYLPLAAQQPADWPETIKALVDQGHPEQALAVTDAWIRAYPEDLDAKAWHARLLAWTQRWPEAEAEFKALLERSPDDTDLLLDLARLLKWQQRYDESLRMLERACRASPAPPDCNLERERLVQLLGETRDSAASQKVAAPAPERSRAARHELRIGGTADLMSYTDNAGSAAVSLDSRWNKRWGSVASITHYDRFGQAATSYEGNVTYRFTGADALTLGGGTAGDQGIVPRLQLQFDYDHGFRLPGKGFLRGVEADYQQRWLWYQGAHALNLSPGAILYLPKDWRLLLRAGMTRLALTSQTAWKPSAVTRLTFPIRRALSGEVLVATGTENFGTVDQVLWHSTRTVGGGLRVRLATKQELIPFLQQQRFAPGKSDTSLGITYGFRF